MAVPKGLAARAILEIDDGRKLHIKVKDASKFSNFYAISTVTGRGRKRVVKPEIPRYRGFAEDLDDAAHKIADTINQHAKRTGKGRLVKTKTRVYRKRLYRKLLSMRPDELGLTKIRVHIVPYGTQVDPNKPLPASYTPFAKRWQIITK